MSWSLLALCAAAFALVAVATSIAIAALLPWLERFGAGLGPRARVRLWIALAALPAVVGALALEATLLPAFGLGADHCLAHDPHHPHLCPHHAAGAPGALVVLIGALLALRVAHAITTFAVAAHASSAASRALESASDRRGDVLVFPAEEAQAFVLGLLRPKVHAASALFAMGDEIVRPALAHERAHARHRDLLWRALCSVLAAAHLPPVAARIARRVASAQEIAADADAAADVGDPLLVAEALLTLAGRQHAPAPGLSFTHGELEARVRALSTPRRAASPLPVRLLVAGCAIAVAAIAALHGPIHHGLETLLGALS